MSRGSWHLELGEVSGRFPVLIITDAGATWEPDGDPVGCVSLRLGELSPCDLPHGSFLSGVQSLVKENLPQPARSNTDQLKPKNHWLAGGRWVLVPRLLLTLGDPREVPALL